MIGKIFCAFSGDWKNLLQERNFSHVGFPINSPLIRFATKIMLRQLDGLVSLNTGRSMSCILQK